MLCVFDQQKLHNHPAIHEVLQLLGYVHCKFAKVTSHGIARACLAFKPQDALQCKPQMFTCGRSQNLNILP